MDTNKIELPEGWFVPLNVQTYREFFEALPDHGVAVELGCWKGRSICSVGDIIIRKHISVYCIDTFKGSQTPEEGDWFKEGFTKDIEAVFKENISRFGLDEYVTTLAMRTTEAVDYVPDEVDLIFIDADHGYASVKEDITNWMPKLRDGGLLSGHDYGRPEVKDAVHEMLVEVHVDNPNESNIWSKQIWTPQS